MANGAAISEFDEACLNDLIASTDRTLSDVYRSERRAVGPRPRAAGILISRTSARRLDRERVRIVAGCVEFCPRENNRCEWKVHYPVG